MRVVTAIVAVTIGVFTVPALTQQKPAAPKQAPAAQAATAAPFPEGAKIAYCSLTLIAQQSKEGAAMFQKVKVAQDQRVKAIQDKTKAMEANQALATAPSVAADRRALLQKEVTRQQTEIQRMQQDAQTEIGEMAKEVEDGLSKRVMPVIEQVAKEKGLHMVLGTETDALLWVHPGLDLTSEIVKRLDATSAGATAKAPGVPPASK
jgi:Skp family chaperone for outer membrane proteins